MKKGRTIELRPRAAAAVVRGHPWVYREGCATPPAGELGELVSLAHGRDRLGTALLDPSGPIALRVLDRDPSRAIDEAWVTGRIVAAKARRPAAALPGTTAYRLLNGEGDGLPGVVIDRYGAAAVVRTDGPAPCAFAERFRRALLASLDEPTVLHRDPRGPVDGVVAWRGQVPEPFVVTEHGMRMVVDLGHGQKTGAFLDQREHRRRVRDLARGKRVLNLCSYQGGFSLAAALGGATHTTSVDVAAKGHEIAKESFRAEGLDPEAHAFVTRDVFDFLARRAQRREVWDLVVSDPPSFAPSERAKPRALEAYRRLHRAAALVTRQGGVLCAASCSSHIGQGDFLSTLDVSAIGVAFTVLEVGGQPFDHPTTPAWAEGRYLKWVVLSKDA